MSPVTSGELANDLLKETGLEFKIIPNNIRTGGLCKWDTKEIYLSFPAGSTVLWALFEAAHEVGHAYHGPIVWQKNCILSSFLIIFSFVLAGFSGYVNLVWPVGVIFLFYFMFFFSKWQSEVKASNFAREKLIERFKQEYIKTALDKRVKLDAIYMVLECFGAFLLHCFISLTIYSYFLYVG